LKGRQHLGIALSAGRCGYTECMLLI